MKPDYNDLNDLIKRDIRGELDTVEVAYLRNVRRMYDPDEWEAMVIHAVVELDAEGYVAVGGRPESRPKGSRQWVAIGSVAAGLLICLTLVYQMRLTRQLWVQQGIYQVARCNEIPEEVTMPLRDFGVQVSTGGAAVVAHELEVDPGQSGLVDRLGEWEVVRNAWGQFELRRSAPLDVSGLLHGVLPQAKARSMAVLSDGSGDDGHLFEFSTRARQQAEIKLPGGTIARLNAVSSLSYRDDAIVLQGEGYFSIGKPIPGEARLPVQVMDLELTTLSDEAGFTVLARERSISMVLLSGSVRVRSLTSGKTWTMKHARTRYQWSLGLPVRGTVPQLGDLEHWLTTPLQAQEEPLAWTHFIRRHKRIALKQFIMEMARWYDIRIEGLDCVSDRYVSTEFCYRNSLEQFLEALNGAGATARLHHGIYYFCPPHTGPPLAAGGDPTDRLTARCCLMSGHD